MAKHIDPTIKQAALQDVKNGVKVSEAAAKYGMTSNAIYLWLKAQSDNTGINSLEMAKLRRENMELRELVGLFALEKRRAEKNMGHP